MQAVLSRSLLLYQNGHNGRIPRKLFVHKTSHFTEDEIQGSLDAFGGKTEIELVQVVRVTNWHGLKVDGPKERLRQQTTPLIAAFTCQSVKMSAFFGRREVFVE
jgi:hypothetical protein